MDFLSDTRGDVYKPSIFELIAQEQLRDLLQPAVKYVLGVFAQRYPRYLIRIFNKHEEFYAAIMLLVERHYLRKHGASFSENFYGLVRRRRPVVETEKANIAVGRAAEPPKLRERDIQQSLLLLVGIPYLRAKAQDYFESLGGGMSSDLLGELESARATASPQTWKQRWQQLFKKYYPILNVLFELWLASYNIAYLFDKSPFYRPWLKWMGLDLRRAPPPQQNVIPPKEYASLWHRIRATLTSSPRLALDSLKVLVPLSIFFIKFLEWWYSPSSPARALSAAPKGPPVPPPRLLSPHPKGIPVDPTRYGICPICQQPIANATVLPTGYAFCYRCIHPEVEAHGRCPVTLHPVEHWQLRKIMV
ncbi:ubiquitin-protein ligase peroxin 12 [Serendipita sp. 396]|nr:ubiquitin-protein ligase peroxin 12 [Serendipita sp. 396]KAG8781704.1 ubiquitin-protein ligase peroxin 12 [Serendipita sp. 397]KAG8796459.1 ubiquitin-protein ligase peroxin 12 [Serendipita sp. 398]KAG8866462.1 ubiquitin-protein ligase peroxin 12 [Serendipita sp. 405]